MIKSIYLHNLRNGEYIQLMTDILAIVAKNDPNALQVSEPYNTLKAKLDSIESIFKIQQGNVISDELFELDARRDNAINGIISMVNAYSYSTDENLKKQALLLQNHLSAFGSGIARDNYQSQTASIRNILFDWNEQPELQAALTALNLEAWRTELSNANTLFGERYLDRAQQTGTASSESIKSKRMEANEHWYGLRDLINAHFTINKGAETYGGTVSFINGLLEYYNNLIARRGQTEAPPEVPAEPVMA
jgi:hypothetical protein